MPDTDRVILVTGATGRQGGAAVRHLLADGWRVRALVRDPTKEAARALTALGAKLVVGDLMDRASLDAAVAGAYGVFSVQTFRDVGAAAEEQQGRNLADAALAAGVEHFVYDSVRGADRESGPPWVVSKNHIEDHIRAIGIPHTIWRPVTFMENWLGQRDVISAGRLTGFEAPDAVHQFIAVDDIGRFVALAFRERDCWLGQATEIAGDQMAWDDVATVLTNVLDLPVVYEQVEPPAGMAAGAPDTSGLPQRAADLPALRDLVPDLLTIDRWARTIDWIA